MAVDERPLRLLGVGLGRSINFLRWARHLTRRGHDVHIVSDRFDSSPTPEGIVAHDVTRLGLATAVPGVRRAVLPAAIGRLARSLAVDLVHGHYLLPYGYWAARCGVRPLVVSPWGTDVLVHAQENRRGARWAREAIAAADLLVVNSRANERATIELGGDPGRIRRVVWYSELDRFGPDARDPGLRGRFGWPEDALVVLSLRKFKPDCNLDVLVRAFARVAREEPAARLLLAAQSGPLRDQIRALADTLGLAPVVAFHTARSEELPGLVASADLTVSITNSDSTPASLLEAMASRLPVVAGIAPSIDEWVAQDDGAELVPPRDEGAVAAAVLRLLRDPELRRRYGERNERVVRTRLGDPGAELEQLYRELLAP
jgi:glycosyltransferase involved in cell wall biosynthesis